jgi:NADP-dependent 3-hydroxy acid dehydrogenase YdfG
MRQTMDRALPLVMVTGASSGIGKALAMAFARDGHPLITAAVGAAVAVHGPVGCLVNNAGMADARAFDEVDEPSYARELDTNLKGVFNCTKAVLSRMRARQSGTIINISSVSDRKTSPVALAYTASKHAVRAFGESLREAEAKNGIGSSTLPRATSGRISTAACISASRNTAPGSATRIS